jgi:hypothetical protein
MNANRSSIWRGLTRLGYLDRVFAEEESAQCQFGVPVVDGDRAAVPWTAQ